jgi:hypothetical protein
MTIVYRDSFRDMYRDSFRDMTARQERISRMLLRRRHTQEDLAPGGRAGGVPNHSVGEKRGTGR